MRGGFEPRARCSFLLSRCVHLPPQKLLQRVVSKYPSPKRSWPPSGISPLPPYHGPSMPSWPEQLPLGCQNESIIVSRSEQPTLSPPKLAFGLGKPSWLGPISPRRRGGVKSREKSPTFDFDAKNNSFMACISLTRFEMPASYPLSFGHPLCLPPLCLWHLDAVLLLEQITYTVFFC